MSWSSFAYENATLQAFQRSAWLDLYFWIYVGVTSTIVFTSSPQDVKALFRMNERFPCRPPMEYISIPRLAAGYGYGLTNSVGDEWLQVNTMCAACASA